MGSHLLHRYEAARQVFRQASDVLDYDIRRRCLEGPTAELSNTRLAQPALFTCNAAALASLRALGVASAAVAGHSVGEFNALAAADVLSFVDALQAVQQRANLMSSVEVPGAMLAIIGIAATEVRQLCEAASEGEALAIAAYNAPLHTVVSGTDAAIRRCAELASALPSTKAVRLNVSHAFHSPLMEEVVPEWRNHVAKLALRDPVVPIVLNTTGLAATGADQLRAAMVDQVTHPVQWVQTTDYLLRRGISELVEVGHSRVLTRFARQQHAGLHVVSLADSAAAEEIAAEDS